MTEDLTNQPGVGAEELASRAARRAARLCEDQAMGRAADSAVEQQLAQAVRKQRNYSQGAEGERLVAQTLGFLERYGWVTLHDIHWPGRPQANIDHMAVGPGGVVVIDAKNWTGNVMVQNASLRQNGYSRARETVAVTEATSAVASLLAPEHRTATRAVLCLVAQDVEPVTVGQTVVVGRSDLGRHLIALPPRLSAYDVADIARHLSTTLAGRRSPTVLTTAGLDRPARRPLPRMPDGAGVRRPLRAARPAAERRRQVPAHTGGRSARARGASRRVRQMLVKVALVVALMAFGPTIITSLVAALSASVTSSVTPPFDDPTETPPDPAEVAPTP